jgi:hypothetical protein
LHGRSRVGGSAPSLCQRAGCYQSRPWDLQGPLRGIADPAGHVERRGRLKWLEQLDLKKYAVISVGTLLIGMASLMVQFRTKASARGQRDNRHGWYPAHSQEYVKWAR